MGLTLAMAAALGPVGVPVTAAAPLAFGKAIVIDQTRAGGEPSVYVDRKGTWLYSSHAGTTHFFKQGALNAPDFIFPYRGETYLYRCDRGAACGADPTAWQFIDIAGTGLHSIGTGFSDPDFAEDAAGTLYHAEITLASTDVNASTDDGKSWTGNPLAPNGDRPWLAADGPGVVYLNMDPTGASNTFYKSTDSGKTFGSGVADSGTLPDGRNIQGHGKPLVDPRTHALVTPAWVYGGGGINGVGVTVSTDGGATFKEYLAANDNIYRTFWAMLTEDRAGTLYMAWDQSDNLGSYSGRHPVAIRYAYSRDGGVHWSKPIDVTRPGVSVFWPSLVGGSDGMLGLAWYQSDTKGAPESDTSNLRVYAAQVSGANTAHPQVDVVNASGVITHTGTVCQDGTACNAQVADDRRLGEYVSTYLDPAGHMMISYSTTADHPDSPVSRPGLVAQVGGASFLSGPDLGHTGAPAIAGGGGGTPTTSTVGAGSALLALALAGMIGGLLLARRRLTLGSGLLR